MRIKSFFKLLNKKINKYDKAVSNPFEAAPITITLVWVENEQIPHPKPPHPNEYLFSDKLLPPMFVLPAEVFLI